MTSHGIDLFGYASPFSQSIFHLVIIFFYIKQNTCPFILPLKLKHSLKDTCKFNKETQNQAKIYSCFTNKIFKCQTQRSALLLNVHDGPVGNLLPLPWLLRTSCVFCHAAQHGRHQLHFVCCIFEIWRVPIEMCCKCQDLTVQRLSYKIEERNQTHTHTHTHTHICINRFE